MKKLLNIAIWLTLASPPFVSAMGLLPKSEGQAAWEALEGRVLSALGGSCAAVEEPAGRISAISAPGAARGELALNKMAAAGLHPLVTVKFVIGPEKKQGKPQDTGGLLTFNAPATGTYVLGTVGTAWIDLVDQERNDLARARHYEWVNFCDRRMKAGIFELRAGARYWIQVSASPEPTLDLFLAGPLN